MADGRIYPKWEVPIKYRTQRFSTISSVCVNCSQLEFSLVIFLLYSWKGMFYNLKIKTNKKTQSYVRANAVVIVISIACYNKICFFEIKVFTGVLCSCIHWFLVFCVCFPSHATQMFHVLSYRGNLVSVGVPLHFGAVSILLPPPHCILKNFVGTPFKDVKSGNNLYFLSDLSLVSVTWHLLTGLVGGRVVFGTSWTLMTLFLKYRNFGFKSYFRTVVISSRKINYFTPSKNSSKFGSMLYLSPLSELLCLQLGSLF